jgi:hypothetical protein
MPIRQACRPTKMRHDGADVVPIRILEIARSIDPENEVRGGRRGWETGAEHVSAGGDEFDFDQGILGQSGGLYGGTRGRVRGEISCVGLIHRGEIVHVT